MDKRVDLLTWVFFLAKGITDNVDLMRCKILCHEIVRLGFDATIDEVKNTSGYRGCLYDIPDRFLTDEKIKEMIDFKL